ncbi:MAG: NrfD/PsrC family molybdoenzyme membrane anchor subunit [Bryobacteraceae bacterium]
MSRVRKLKLALWMVTGVAMAVAVARFLYGLGATTHLSDANPWGLWVGFDVMSGVALAAGGFIVTATVYVFRLERFHAVVRPAVLTAFLGYLAVAVGLLFDLGLPWNIWHMIVFWNPHSPLFEVGWCVMLYLTVLALEFFPVPAEEFGTLAGIRRFLVRLRMPLVVIGIGLSSLHQSSLGSLFLIMPYRLHPLWYSPLLPIMFLVSAIGLGLLMVIFESNVTAFLYHRKPETEVLAGLGSAARWVLAGYLILRFGDLLARRQGQLLFASGWRTGLFWFEVVVMAAAPAALLFLPAARRSRAIQWTAASLGVFGVVLNRLDVGGLAQIRPPGMFYLPSWTEIAVSAGIVAAAILLFLFMIERFRIWEQRPADPDADPLKLPEFNPVDSTWLGVPAIAARTTYSLGFVFAAAAGFAFLGNLPAKSRGAEPAPVQQARGGDKLWIDGNLDGRGVLFPHEEHEKREGGNASCVKCHHMNFPRDLNSACARCHRDMYQPTDAFRHDWHASPEGGRLSCAQCHPLGQTRVASTAVRCDRCHKNLVPAGSTIAVKTYAACSYADAMHRLCIGCHVQKAREKNKPEMTRCAWCHKETHDVVDAPGVPRPEDFVGRNVVLPAPVKSQ